MPQISPMSWILIIFTIYSTLLIIMTTLPHLIKATPQTKKLFKQKSSHWKW